jgi:hypothetical protein
MTSPENAVNLSAGLLGAVTLTATLSTRVNQAIPLLLGGARFSRAVKSIECANQSQPFGEFWEEIRDNAVACIFFVSASLESYTNELFSDRDQVFADHKMKVLEKFWKTFERKSSLEKFNLALILRDKEEMDEKSHTYKAMTAVIKLRNALTHFKPEWSHSYDKHLKLSKELEGYFAPSGITGDKLIFPMAWAGHSCTSWAVNTTVTFLKEFEVAADVPNRTNWAAFDERLKP